MLLPPLVLKNTTYSFILQTNGRIIMNKIKKRNHMHLNAYIDKIAYKYDLKQRAEKSNARVPVMKEQH